MVKTPFAVSQSSIRWNICIWNSVSWISWRLGILYEVKTFMKMKNFDWKMCCVDLASIFWQDIFIIKPGTHAMHIPAVDLIRAMHMHAVNVICFQMHDDVIKWTHFPRYWPFVRGIPRSPANSPHKGQWRRALMFSLICARINGWVNNGEVGNLRPYRAHYDVTVMGMDDTRPTKCMPSSRVILVRLCDTMNWHFVWQCSF